MEIPLCDLLLKTQRYIYSLKYRELNSAGYTSISSPQLDLTEAAILEAAAASQAASAQLHRRDRQIFDFFYTSS